MARKTSTAKLRSARVTNFGCFRDSGEVPLDEVTALIAENENGKTTFLRALAWWSDSSVEFDEEDRWAGADPDEVLDIVALRFELNAPTKEAFREAGVNKPPDTVTVVRDSAGAYRVEDEKGALVEPTRGPTRFDVAKKAFAEELLKYAARLPTTTSIADPLEAAQPGSGLVEAALSRTRSEVLQTLTPDEVAAFDKKLAAMELAITDPVEVDPLTAVEVIDPFLPQLIYFDEQMDFVRDAITYAEVEADPSAHRTMINLATAAGIDLVQVASETPHRRLHFSQQAQQTLSSEFSKYWQGEPVTVYVQIDESQMTLTIEHRGRTQRPSRRSSGLKWQLGFFVNFTAESKGDLSGAVLLLDEPGLHLHIKQQPKLLELFDDLARDGCRIIYATHLSHMLAPDKPHRFRPLIPDPKAPEATTVVPNITALPSKSDVMQPVRQSLGMGIADAIGLGGSNVIAEGWAERYVLLVMSEFCRDTGRSALAATTTVLPAGGSGKKMLPLAAMAVAEKTRAVVLVDDDKAGRDTVGLLEKTLPGGVPSVLTHAEDEPTGRELEDVFAPEYYLDLVNGAHAAVDGYVPIAVEDIDLTKPICNAIEDRFKANGLGRFQKLRPAMELQRRQEVGERPDDQTLDRFGALFDRLTGGLRKV